MRISAFQLRNFQTKQVTMSKWVPILYLAHHIQVFFDQLEMVLYKFDCLLFFVRTISFVETFVKICRFGIGCWIRWARWCLFYTEPRCNYLHILGIQTIATSTTASSILFNHNNACIWFSKLMLMFYFAVNWCGEKVFWKDLRPSPRQKLQNLQKF